MLLCWEVGGMVDNVICTGENCTDFSTVYWPNAYFLVPEW